MKQRKVLITGASGMIGSRLCHRLESAGHHVLRAVRREVRDSACEVRWSISENQIETEKLEGLDAVVHLAGANVAGHRWTENYKREIRESRTKGTELISSTLAGLADKPKVFACASAIGYYGDRGSEELDESSPPGTGFLPEVCTEWERACQNARDAGIRTVNMRIGVVLSTEGGALRSMLLPFKLGVGGVLGSGKQYFSWIALDDVVAAIHFVVGHESLSGPVNLVAPAPATNRQYTKTLGSVLHRPTIFPMPAFAARLAFGEMADELLLSSTRVKPQSLLEHGFRFEYPQLHAALQHVLS